MEKDIIDGKIGNVGSYDVEFKGGKLVAKVAASPASGVNAIASIEVDAGMVMDAIAKAIPGTIDDALLGVVKAALLNQ